MLLERCLLLSSTITPSRRSFPIIRNIMSGSTMSTNIAPSSSSTTVGETNLDKLLAHMEPHLDPETYVFTTFQEIPKQVSSLQVIPRMVFQEEEGITLIVTQDQAQQYQWTFEYPCRRIVLKIHSSLEAIGFLATITQHLAFTKNLSVNAVSAFHHDHLFVPSHQVQKAMDGLNEIVMEARKKQEDVK